MPSFSRRRFLSYAGGLALAATAAPALPRGLHLSPRRARAQGALDYAAIDPRDPATFTRPLHVPGRAGGLLGLLDVGAAPVEIVARPASLELLPGRQTPLLGYAVEQDGSAYINPVLRMEAGQEVAARLVNELDEPTIIHWHGLHVPTISDGHPAQVIGTGGTYEYAFTVRNRSGLYWYHPHPDMRTAWQAYHGLAGPLIVEDDDDRALSAALGLEMGVTDLPLVIQDKRFGADGSLLYDNAMMTQMQGFTGDVVLVNGTINPVLAVDTRVYRLRLLNGSNARIYRIAAEAGSGRLPLRLIGTDGGLLAAPIEVEEVFLAPGERADLLLDLRGLEPGDAAFLTSLPFEPMHNMMPGMGGMMGGMATASRLAEGARFHLLKLAVRDRVAHDREVPARLSTLPEIDLAGAPVRPFRLSFQMMQWLINGTRFEMERDLFEVSRAGAEIWEIINPVASAPHPMHFHGYQGLVLERRGSPAQVRALATDAQGRIATDHGLKDTVLVWPGETVRVAIDFRHPFPGEQRYLFHCHILEHEDAGMMVNFRVA